MGGTAGSPRDRAWCTRRPGPEVTQRSRGHQRQPLALALIPGVPRPPLSLQRPARPARAKFPRGPPGSPASGGSRGGPRAPLTARGTRLSSLPPLPRPPALAGRFREPGTPSPAAALTGVCPARRRGPCSAPPLASLPRWRPSIALPPALPCGRRLRAQPSALRWGLEAAGHAPRLPGPPSPALATARCSALGAEPPPRGQRNFPSSRGTLCRCPERRANSGGRFHLRLLPPSLASVRTRGWRQRGGRLSPNTFRAGFHFFAEDGCLDLPIGPSGRDPVLRPRWRLSTCFLEGRGVQTSTPPTEVR